MTPFRTNVALMTKAGVLTSVNSDSAELARHLNQDAAKAMKYGGLSEEEALKLCTLNGAKQLRLDHRIGSIDVGKDADIRDLDRHRSRPTRASRPRSSTARSSSIGHAT